jgi:hypothetical protein
MSPRMNLKRALRRAATESHDWTGAALVRSGEASVVPKPDAFVFHLWRCPARRELHLLTGADSLDAVPEVIRELGWDRSKRISETGQPRIGFVEADAKRDIAARGFHLVRVARNRIEPVPPPYDAVAAK